MEILSHFMCFQASVCLHEWRQCKSFEFCYWLCMPIQTSLKFTSFEEEKNWSIRVYTDNLIVAAVLRSLTLSSYIICDENASNCWWGRHVRKSFPSFPFSKFFYSRICDFKYKQHTWIGSKRDNGSVRPVELDKEQWLVFGPMHPVEWSRSHQHGDYSIMITFSPEDWCRSHQHGDYSIMITFSPEDRYRSH